MKIKIIERLRAALEEEREAAAREAYWPTERTTRERNEARAETERLIAKIERMLQRAAERNAGGPRPTLSDGGIVPGGGRIIGDQGGIEQFTSSRPGYLESIASGGGAVVDILQSVSEPSFDREAWRRGYSR